MKLRTAFIAVQWRHNERGGVSNHQPYDCLLKRLFGRRSKKTSKLRVTSLCEGNSLVTGEFPAQMASNTENVFIWWRHHVTASTNIPTDVVISKSPHTSSGSQTNQPPIRNIKARHSVNLMQWERRIFGPRSLFQAITKLYEVSPDEEISQYWIMLDISTNNIYTIHLSRKFSECQRI